jgi:hypothetical protein
MQIDKSMILGLLQERGQTEQAEQAQRELPDQIDTDRDAGMLEKFGLSPQDLLARLGGGGGIPGL